MELTKKQKALLEFIPVSGVRKSILLMSAGILYLIPVIIGSQFGKLGDDFLGYKVTVVLMYFL